MSGVVYNTQSYLNNEAKSFLREIKQNNQQKKPVGRKTDEVEEKGIIDRKKFGGLGIDFFRDISYT